MKLSKEAWFGIIPGGEACKHPRRRGLALYQEVRPVNIQGGVV